MSSIVAGAFALGLVSPIPGDEFIYPLIALGLWAGYNVILDMFEAKRAADPDWDVRTKKEISRPTNAVYAPYQNNVIEGLPAVLGTDQKLIISTVVAIPVTTPLSTSLDRDENFSMSIDTVDFQVKSQVSVGTDVKMMDGRQSNSNVCEPNLCTPSYPGIPAKEIFTATLAYAVSKILEGSEMNFSILKEGVS